MNRDKINNILSYQIPPHISNIIAFVIFYCFSCLLFVCNAEAIAIVDESLQEFIFWITTEYGLRAYFTIFILFGTIYCLSGNLFISYLILEIVSIGWGIANRIVFLTRDQFITIAEFDVLGDAAGVNVDIDLILHPILIVLGCIGVVFGIFAYKLSRSIKREPVMKITPRALRLFRVILIFGFVITFMLLHAKREQDSFDNIIIYRKTGDIVWFCQSLFGNTTEAVSQEKIQELYRNFTNELSLDNIVSTKRPNVIVIMSEGFWNLNNLEGIVQVNENPMDRYFELVENAVTGQVAVNIFGGGTNTSEFEFLTGINSKYMRHGSYYGGYFAKKQESLVSYMEELGYYTMAFHPYEKTFWDRELGYTNMGFDAFYSDVDFENREMCHGYISDKSLTKEIIGRFEEHKKVYPEQPVFSFAVSIQNHVADMSGIDKESKESGSKDIIVTLVGNEVTEITKENVEEHYNGMKDSIEALDELMRYFEEYEEDTVIVFFGDHAPGFVKTICDTEGRETELNVYRTPYVIWSNYENDFETYGDMSLPYFSSVLIEYLDFPKPNQYYMNKYMLLNYTINTRYEQEYSSNINEERIRDMMSIMSTIHNRFTREEFAIPYWQVME